MANKWRLLFLLFPELLSSNLFHIQRLILSLLFKFFVISNHSFSILSDVEWNINLLSFLNFPNGSFLPFSSKTWNNSIYHLFSFITQNVSEATTNSQDLWNGLSQSLYCQRWDPAEILSPVKPRYIDVYFRKYIFILGRFPAARKEFEMFFTSNLDSFEVESLSNLFFKQVLPPDLTKLLLSHSIRLVWINTNTIVSPLSLQLQKSIRPMIFVNYTFHHSFDSMFSFLPFSLKTQLVLPSPYLFPISNICVFNFFGIQLIQPKLHVFHAKFPSLNKAFSRKFSYKLDREILLCNCRTLFSIRILARLKSSRFKLLTLFDFELIFFITNTRFCQIGNLDYYYFAVITDANLSSYMVVLRFISSSIAYSALIINTSPLIFNENYRYQSLNDSPAPFFRCDSHYDIDYTGCSRLQPFSLYLLSPVSTLLLCRTHIFSPYFPTLGKNDLLDWIEDDVVFHLEASLSVLYLNSRPCPSSVTFQLADFLSSRVAYIESDDVQRKHLIDSNKRFDQVDISCDVFFDLICSVLQTSELSSNANSLLRTLIAKNADGGTTFSFTDFSLSHIFKSLAQIKIESLSTNQLLTSIENQILLRFLLYPISHRILSNHTPEVYISECISLLRFLTISTNPSHVTEFMLQSLVNNCDKSFGNVHIEFLKVLYTSLGHKPPKVFSESVLTLSRDSDESPTSRSPTCILPQSPPSDQKDFSITGDSFHGLFSNKSREILVMNRNSSSSIELIRKEKRTSKRALFDSGPNSDKPKTTGTPNKKVKILCDETPLRQRNSNRLLTNIRNEQLKNGIHHSDDRFVLDPAQRDFYSEIYTQPWKAEDEEYFTTPERKLSLISAFHSPLLTFESTTLQYFLSPRKSCISPSFSNRCVNFASEHNVGNRDCRYFSTPKGSSKSLDDESISPTKRLV